jgi:hypothetical protein
MNSLFLISVTQKANNKKSEKPGKKFLLPLHTPPSKFRAITNKGIGGLKGMEPGLRVFQLPLILNVYNSWPIALANVVLTFVNAATLNLAKFNIIIRKYLRVSIQTYRLIRQQRLMLLNSPRITVLTNRN